jgi:HlyD family secretion protein
MNMLKSRILAVAVVLALVLAVAAVLFWRHGLKGDLAPGVVSGNGRIEATEINLAARVPGRLAEVLVGEGDFVKEGQVLARIQTDILEAQLLEAQAKLRQAKNAIITAQAQVTARESEKLAAEAVVLQRESEEQAAQQRLVRTESLATKNAVSEQNLDDDRARAKSAEAAIKAAKAQVAAAGGAVAAASAQVQDAEVMVEAVQATVGRVQAELDDCTLKAPRDGRVQYLITQPGEVLGAGGKVLNLVDLGDVYLTFFLPETVAGRVALGSEVRLILDAAPQYVIPARVSYVASVAQFTPKTVETASERQKLMFRVKAQIDRGLLREHLERVKTGLPGVAWVKLEAQAEWPSHLVVKLPK